MPGLPPLHVSAVGLPGGEDRVDYRVVDDLISLSSVPDAGTVDMFLGCRASRGAQPPTSCYAEAPRTETCPLGIDLI